MKMIHEQIQPIKEELGGDPETDKELQKETDYIDRVQVKCNAKNAFNK
jgi:ATP-dependent Lon protease